MSELNDTGMVIASTTPEEIRLDLQIKKVLACKPILSRILAEVVDECRGMSFGDIEACIEGDVLVEQVNVEPGFTNIVGLSQEDYVNGEGFIKYDIRTYLRLPGQEKAQYTKILIDVEAQKDENPGYDIPTRGLYYCARMLSSQLSTEFSVKTNDTKKYGNIKKVYSIWICTETSGKRANSIEKYSINREVVYGRNEDLPKYDILSTVVVNLSKESNTLGVDNEMILFLTDLFDKKQTVKEKLELLENKYHIKVTSDIEEEVGNMCSYTAAVKQEGRAEGLAEGLAEGRVEGRKEDIEKMLRSGKTAEQIAEFCGYDLNFVQSVQEEMRNISFIN